MLEKKILNISIDSHWVPSFISVEINILYENIYVLKTYRVKPKFENSNGYWEKNNVLKSNDSIKTTEQVSCASNISLALSSYHKLCLKLHS
jgi:hypothetical protein